MALFAGSCAARSFSGPSAELEEATAISNAFLATLGRDPKDLKLVRTENLIYSGANLGGPAIWRFDYQERKLIPSKDNLSGGIGGGLFIEVDLDLKKAKFLGVGE